MDDRKVSCPPEEAMLTDSLSFPISPTMSDEIVDRTADAVAKVVRHFSA